MWTGHSAAAALQKLATPPQPLAQRASSAAARDTSHQPPSTSISLPINHDKDRLLPLQTLPPSAGQSLGPATLRLKQTSRPEIIQNPLAVSSLQPPQPNSIRLRSATIPCNVSSVCPSASRLPIWLLTTGKTCKRPLVDSAVRAALVRLDATMVSNDEARLREGRRLEMNK